MIGALLDPAARRLRRDLLLLLVGVALPSLLLTGFGLIAIDNELDAALQRTRALYHPMARGLARRLEAELEAPLEASLLPLGEYPQLLPGAPSSPATAPNSATAAAIPSMTMGTAPRLAPRCSCCAKRSPPRQVS